MDLNQVVQAIEIVHSHTSAPDLRKQAQDFVESVKADAAQCLNVSTQILASAVAGNTSQSDVVTHFGLHCLEHVVLVGWNSLNDEQKQHLKQRALEMLSQSSRYITEQKVPV